MPYTIEGGGVSPGSSHLQAKVTIVGKTEIYITENLVGPFLVHSTTSLPPPPNVACVHESIWATSTYMLARVLQIVLHHPHDFQLLPFGKKTQPRSGFEVDVRVHLRKGRGRIGPWARELGGRHGFVGPSPSNIHANIALSIIQPLSHIFLSMANPLQPPSSGIHPAYKGSQMLTHPFFVFFDVGLGKIHQSLKGLICLGRVLCDAQGRVFMDRGNLNPCPKRRALEILRRF